MLPLTSPEPAAVHIIEVIPEIIEAKQTTAIPPMPVAEGIFYSVDNYLNPNGCSNYVNEHGIPVPPPLEALTVGNELRMIDWVLTHQGILPPKEAA